MTELIVDFETYYDREISVVTQGLRNYVQSADAYLVSVVGEGFEFCGTLADLAHKAPALLSPSADVQFWAANANFDHAFWRKHYGETAHPWQCVLDLSAFHQLPRDLERVARVALGKTLDKSARDAMKGVHFETLPKAERERMIAYCLEDSRTAYELTQKLPPMSPVEERLAAHTRLLNRRGVHVNAEKINRDLRLLADLRVDAVNKLPWVESGEAPLSATQFALYCEARGVAAPASLDKRDLACARWMEAHPELGAIVQSMRTVRGMATKVAKLESIAAAADSSGIIPLDLLYCGARHTRRWSSKNINVQNLDAQRVFADEMAGLPYYKEHPEEKPGIFMREYFLPPPGCVFGILDFSQIEPRCLNWLVGNEEMISAIRAGYGIYEAHAKASMRWTGAPGTLKHSDPTLYKFAKERVLSLGYGMGWEKFRDRAKSKLGLDLTDAQAQAQVANFRTANPRITGQWKSFQALIRSAAYEKDKTLEITMPSGDLLKHFHVRGKGRGLGFESFTTRGDFSQASHVLNFFGGALTENVTQRMARDILALSILRLEDAGLPVIFHAHDEVILALDKNTAQKDFAEARRLMSIAPDWCPDIPLAVDGEIHPHYTKLS